MTRKNHFYYDSDRCEFVPIEYDLKKKLIHSFSFWLINGIVLASFGIALLSNYVGTPAEIMLKDENQALVEQLKLAETSITDIEIFPLISFLIFFSVFVGFIIYVITMRKSTAQECANIPINDEPNQ